MAVDDRWVNKRTRQRTPRYGSGLRYRVRVPGHPSRSFRTKGAADAHERRLLDSEPAKPGVWVGDLVDQWLRTKAHLSRKGREACDTAATAVRARWGDELAGEVAPSDVEVWLAEVGHSASWRGKALQCLRGSLRLAVRDGLLDRDPTDGIRVRQQATKDPRFLSVDELDRLAQMVGQQIEETGADDWAMTWLLGTTGIRIGECCALDVTDVDVTRRRLRVRRSKNGRPRDVPIPALVLDMLDLRHDGPLFRSAWGERIAVNNWRRRRFHPAASAAGLLPLTPHDLRHTAASLAIASGANPKVVQRMLGHQTIAMTLDLYGHLWDEDLDTAATRTDARVRAILGPSRISRERRPGVTRMAPGHPQVTTHRHT